MGTYVRDALEVDLLDGVDLATDGSDTGDAVEVTWPSHVLFLLETGTVSGTNTIIIQGCETSDFTTADVVRLGSFTVTVNDDDTEFGFETNTDARYVRAVVTIGTGGDMTASTIKVVPPDYHRARSVFPTSAVLA